MSHFRHAMLSPVLELVKSSVESIPHGDHSFFQKLCSNETESVLSDTLQLAEATDEQKQEAFELLGMINEALSIFAKEAKNPAWIQMSPEERYEKIQEIKEAPQVPQRSAEWFRQYGKVLTASEFSTIFLQTKKRRDLIYSKVHPPEEVTSFKHACSTDDMTALGWGIRFEPVVKQLVEYHDKCKIYEAGRLNHKTNTHLAASPDGVIEQASNKAQLGRLIEIKCPYSRTIGKEIPYEYWIQMQIQMEVTDIDECEYVECDIVSRRAHQEDSVDLSGTTYQGIVYVAQNEKADTVYLYGDIGSDEMPDLPEGFECVEVVPWGLKAWHRKLVSRDRAWYEATKPWQESFWRDVETIKKGDDLPPLTPKLKATACLITDD